MSFSRRRKPAKVTALRCISAGLGALALSVQLGSTASASSVAPAALGWWHRATADLPVDLGMIGTPEAARSTLVPVPPGGLYVANDATGQRAVAALRFTPPPTGPVVLTLRLAGESTMPLGARLVACPVTSAWEPATNGRWEERPSLDCAVASEGTFAEDLAVIIFELRDVDPYRSPRGLEIGIAPAAGEVTPFALAFDPPDEDALDQAPETPGDAAQAAVPEDVAPPAQPVDRWVQPRPDPAPVPPTTANEAAADVTAPRLEPVQGTTTRNLVPDLLRIGTDGRARAVITAVLALLAGTAWLVSGGLPVLSHRNTDLEVAP